MKRILLGSLAAGIALFLDIKGEYYVGPFPGQGEVMIANAYPLSPTLASKLTGQLYSSTTKPFTVSGSSMHSS